MSRKPIDIAIEHKTVDDAMVLAKCVIDAGNAIEPEDAAVRCLKLLEFIIAMTLNEITKDRSGATDVEVMAILMEGVRVILEDVRGIERTRAANDARINAGIASMIASKEVAP